MPEVRCKKCNGLLFKGKGFDLEIKCRKCGYINKVCNLKSYTTAK